MSTGKQINGIFLRPTDEEAALIYDACEEYGFPEDGTGVTRLLIALLTGEENEHPSRGVIFKYFKDNPQDLNNLKSLGVAGLQTLFSKLKK